MNMSIMHAEADVCVWNREHAKDSASLGAGKSSQRCDPSTERASGSLACWRNCQQLTWLLLMIIVGVVRRGSEGDKKANRGLVTSDCNALDMAEESEGF